MSHVLILNGTADGGVPPRVLNLGRVTNVNVIGSLRLNYVARDQLTLTKVLNANTFGDLELDNIVVSDLPVTPVVNVTTFGGQTLENLPFTAINSETTALLAVMTGTYGTTAKRQIDATITNLKAAGVWASRDWYGNAYWAVNEHDALLDWTNPARSLVKVGSASWAANLGLNGVNPATSNSRYKSGWNVGDGAHSSGANFSYGCKITAIAVPQNGMQPMGVWRLSTPGPAAPDGSFLILSVLAATGSAGANALPFTGNSGINPGDGLGAWGVSHEAGTHITVKDGATLKTDSISGNSSYTDPDGMSVAGSAGAARRSFPGTMLYWHWGGPLSAAQFAAVESAMTDALTGGGGGVDDALFVDDDEDWLVVDDDGNYLKIGE